MAKFIQELYCNFPRFSNASLGLWPSKTSSKYPICTGFFQHTFGYKRYIRKEIELNNFLTPGVGHIRANLTWIHTSRARLGIDEFFPPKMLETKQPLPEEIKSGTRNGSILQKLAFLYQYDPYINLFVL